jgi:tetratricopeptide (TPR) repeat protein
VLELDASWRLAIDVYEMVLSYSGTSCNRCVAYCHLRIGFCFGSLSAFDAAGRSYSAARSAALASGDIVVLLRSDLGQAQILLRRGNIPAAEPVVERVIIEAKRRGLKDVLARGFLDSSTLAFARGNIQHAAELCLDAYKLSRNPAEKHRMLLDLAGCHLHLNQYESARALYVMIAAMGKERLIRWGARVNLLELESIVGDRAAFDRHARALASAKLPPLLMYGFQMNLGEGYHRFGDSFLGREHVSRALAIASEHGLNFHLFEAELVLSKIGAAISAASSNNDVTRPNIRSAVEELTRNVSIHQIRSNRARTPRE